VGEEKKEKYDELKSIGINIEMVEIKP